MTGGDFWAGCALAVIIGLIVITIIRRLFKAVRTMEDTNRWPGGER